MNDWTKKAWRRAERLITIETWSDPKGGRTRYYICVTGKRLVYLSGRGATPERAEEIADALRAAVVQAQQEASQPEPLEVAI